MVWVPSGAKPARAASVVSGAPSYPSVNSYKISQASRANSTQSDEGGSVKLSHPGSAVGRLDVGGSLKPPGSAVGRLDVGGSFRSSVGGGFGSPVGSNVVSGFPADEIPNPPKSFDSIWYGSSGSAPKSIPGPPMASQGSPAQSIFLPASSATPSQLPGFESIPGPPMSSQGTAAQSIFLPASPATPSQLPGVSIEPSPFDSPTNAYRPLATPVVQFSPPTASPTAVAASQAPFETSSAAGSLQGPMTPALASTSSPPPSFHVPKRMASGGSQPSRPGSSVGLLQASGATSYGMFSNATQPGSSVGLLQAAGPTSSGMFSNATRPGSSVGLLQAAGGASYGVFAGATQPVPPAGLPRGAGVTSYGEAWPASTGSMPLQAPTTSTGSVPARIDIASLDRRSPTPPLMSTPAPQLAATAVAPYAYGTGANLSVNNTGGFELQTRPSYFSNRVAAYDLPMQESAQEPPSFVLAEQRPAEEAGKTLSGMSVDLPQQSSYAWSTSGLGIPSASPGAMSQATPPVNASSYPEGDVQSAKDKVSDKLADFRGFKRHEQEAFRSAIARDEAEQSLVRHALHDVEEVKLESLDKVYSEFREEQLDNRIAYLEHILASVEERPGGTEGLSEAEIEAGPLSWATRDFADIHLPVPLYGFYVDKSKIGQREAQLDHQFGKETHPWIYMLAGKSRQDSVASKWLRENQAWRLNDAFAKAGDAEEYY